MSQQGFTLTEVLIAVFVLALSIIGSSIVQTNALSMSRKAKIINQMTNLATAQLELQRQTNRQDVTIASTGQTCDGKMPSGLNCTIDVVPCSFDGSSFSCSNATVLEPDAHSITVRIQKESYSEFKLSSLVRVN